MKTWTCDTCKASTTAPVDGVNVIRQYDYWWCAHCVKVFKWEDGRPIVDFPSPGMMIPSTIMTEVEG